MVRKINFMKTVAAGRDHGMGRRTQRKKAEAEARKKAAADLEGKSPKQAMAMLKRKKRK